MIEKVYEFTVTEEKVIEKVIMDENLHYMHMVLPKGEGLPVHFSNANVYMTVVRGRLTIALNEQEPHTYPAGMVLNIPYKTKMDAKNKDEAVLELIVIKAPAPKE